eukprot:1531803-Ditylum_brightwellii.AAC.1
MHQTVANVLITTTNGHANAMQQAVQTVDDVLATTVHAKRCAKRQLMINENLRKQNLKQREWNYAMGQEVLIKSVNPSKLEPRAHGPYDITQVFTNGTVKVRRNAHFNERMNIRRLVPFCRM